MNTIGDLITTLQDLAEEHGADAEVLIAQQGHRSRLQYRIEDIVDVELCDDDDTEEGAHMVVYLVEADTESNYLPSRARKAIQGEL